MYGKRVGTRDRRKGFFRFWPGGKTRQADGTAIALCDNRKMNGDGRSFLLWSHVCVHTVCLCGGNARARGDCAKQTSSMVNSNEVKL